MASNNLNWLDEVKRDAEYNYLKRLRDQEERQAYEASKRAPVEPEVVAEPEPQEPEAASEPAFQPVPMRKKGK